jgi:hypothetical protein
MNRKFWFRRLALAAVWGLATSTWTSIGHHLLGMPDVGLLAVATVCAVTFTWPWIANSLGRLAKPTDGGLVKPGELGKSER